MWGIMNLQRIKLGPHLGYTNKLPFVRKISSKIRGYCNDADFRIIISLYTILGGNFATPMSFKDLKGFIVLEVGILVARAFQLNQKLMIQFIDLF